MTRPRGWYPRRPSTRVVRHGGPTTSAGPTAPPRAPVVHDIFDDSRHVRRTLACNGRHAATGNADADAGDQEPGRALSGKALARSRPRWPRRRLAPSPKRRRPDRGHVDRDGRGRPPRRGRCRLPLSRTSGHFVRRDERHRGFRSGPPASSSSSPGGAAGAATMRQSRSACCQARDPVRGRAVLRAAQKLRRRAW